MTLVGIKFLNYPFDVKKYARVIEENSSKPVAKLLFNVRAYCIESDILVVNKEFIASKTMNMMFLVLACISIIPWFVWDVRLPFMIVFFLILLWSLLSTPSFNFIMFIVMIRKLGYKGKVVML